MQSIISRINETAASFTEEDLDKWVVPDILNHYQTRIDFLSNRAYGSTGNVTVAKLAFREMAKKELRTALHTFIFKAQHWKSKRDINPYLMTSLSRLADRTHFDNESVKKINLLICPLCKNENKKEYLIPEGKFWKCIACSQKVSRLEQEIKSKGCTYDKSKLCILNTKSNLYKIFALHSRKGYKCLECSRFIPESINTINGISCPYDDCIFFGKLDELEPIPHPSSLSQRNTISLQKTLNHNGGESENTLQDFLMADTIQADTRLDTQESINKEYDMLLQVINDQMEMTRRMNFVGTVNQKLLMYEAFKSMTDKYPEDMISYLVHQKQNFDFPIQARIFQEYAGLVENALPFKVKKHGNLVDIVDLVDPNLSLFLGITTFEAVVSSSLKIPNNTKETYTGGLKFIEYGPNFIGKLIKVIDTTSETEITNQVKEYSFVDISMKEGVLPGTPVRVTVFSIPSHYEIMSMVFLNRIRRQIVDSIYLRLNKKKRIARNK